MPTLDLGINNAIRKLYGKRNVPKAKQILKLAEKWRPYSTVSVLVLVAEHGYTGGIPPKENGTRKLAAKSKPKARRA